MTFYYFEREPSKGDPGGITVSKTPMLPEGDFIINESVWRRCILWFIQDHNFTQDERDAAYVYVILNYRDKVQP